MCVYFSTSSGCASANFFEAKVPLAFHVHACLPLALTVSLSPVSSFISFSTRRSSSLRAFSRAFTSACLARSSLAFATSISAMVSAFTDHSLASRFDVASRPSGGGSIPSTTWRSNHFPQ
ncbi:hypothetical protein EES44_24700 [Streptomyces sp. ADI96-15]|nr:hypothetical protein EES44_24700 [Streptomyces sp. ADI96-15]